MTKPPKPIPFIDLQAQRAKLGARIDTAVMNAVNGGAYIMGPEVKTLERQLAEFAGTKHCLSCANGTDALGIVLMAWGIKAGDAVFVPSFTFVATAEVVAWVGATPIFVDVLPDTFNIDPASLEKAIATSKKLGLTPAAIIPVDLFGQAADYDAIHPIAERHGLKVMADAAQSVGGTWNKKRIGSLAEVTATSFFPAKPLGCYGDGGAVFCDDDALFDLLVSLRVHGQGTDKYDNVRIGMNGRLDTIQAAVLIEKLAIFPEELIARQRVADRYNAALGDVATTPIVDRRAASAWAQYTLQTDKRDAVAAACKAAGVPTAIYYPIPLPRQTGYRHYPSVEGGTPVSDALSRRVISLPMHPYLDESTQDYIIETVRKALA